MQFSSVIVTVDGKQIQKVRVLFKMCQTTSVIRNPLASCDT